MRKKCRYCNSMVEQGENHRCSGRRGMEVVWDDSDFLTSFAVSAMADGTTLRAAAGDDIIGAMSRDLLDGDLLD